MLNGIGRQLNLILPAPERALLVASLRHGDDAREAYAEWRRDLEWGSLPRPWQMLLPILHQNAITLGIKDPLLERIGGVRRYMWARSLRLMALAKRAHSTLAHAGIPAVALKGSALVASGYVDRSVRTMEDIDILVRPEQIADAMKIFQVADLLPVHFDAPSLLERVIRERTVDGWAFVTGSDLYVDLHWSAIHLDRRVRADDQMWDRVRSVEFDRADMLVPDPVDLVIQIAAHGAKEANANLLRAIADIALVLQATPRFDWNLFLDRARYHRVSAHIANILLLTGEVIESEAAKLAGRQLRSQASPFEALEVKSAMAGRFGTPSLGSQIVSAVSEFRRSRDDLFAEPVAAALGPTLRKSFSTRGNIGALLRFCFVSTGRHKDLRRVLASDWRLMLPHSHELLPMDEFESVPASSLPEAHFVTGWSVAEKEGRWTDGAMATLALPARLRDRPISHICLDVQIALATEKDKISVRIFVADQHIATRHFQGDASVTQIELSIPLNLAKLFKVLPVTFDIRDPIQPLGRGLSRDARQLGLFLRSVRIDG